MTSLTITRQLGIVLLSILLISPGCTTTDPYHTQDGTPDNCRDPSAERCTRSYYQQHTDYDLAFAEFTERGNAFNSEWISNVLAKIRTRAEEQGIILVTFIHGWKHNADEGDQNLIDFKKSLAQIAKSPVLGKRRVVGLYIGWRGANLDLPYLDNLTFWDRKAVAQEVGKGGVTRLLLELDRIDRAGEKTENVLVIIGHSFGGAILVSAVAEVLAERLGTDPRDGSGPRAIGDAILVLNPAIEANQSLNMVEAAIAQEYAADQGPLFVSLSTDADAATHFSFPLGQTLGLLLTWRQLDLIRPYYRDRLSGDTLVLKEEHLDSTTVGNFAPYLTHWLEADTSGPVPNLLLRECEEIAEECAPKGLTGLSGHPTIVRPDHYPFYFIKTNASVMAGHNDIFNEVVHSFVFTLIEDLVRRALHQSGTRSGMRGDGAGRPILSDPERLKERFRQFYPSR